LLAAGEHEAFAMNQDHNVTHLRVLARKAESLGLPVTHVLTACGSCRDGLERHFVSEILPEADGEPARLHDMADFLFSTAHVDFSLGENNGPKHLLYQGPCHAESPGVQKIKAAGQYARTLADRTGTQVTISHGCCGESGMGAITSPLIYNKLRDRKTAGLEEELATLPEDAPMIVSCPSCKMGLTRILMGKKIKRRVAHTLEYLAERLEGPHWSRKFEKLLRSCVPQKDIRLVNMADMAAVQLTEAEAAEAEDER
jgi:Fe-S oxidoreductase